MAQKGFLTPFTRREPDLFDDPTRGQMNEILLNATTFRFDASDLMPGGVGAGSFWTGMVDYTGGAAARKSRSKSRKLGRAQVSRSRARPQVGRVPADRRASIRQARTATFFQGRGHMNPALQG
jgi:hypothetical protein